MNGLWGFMQRALEAEFTDDAGRVNFLGGLLMFALLVLSYIATAGDYVYGLVLAVVRPGEHVHAVPQTPAWGIVLFVVYFVLCVVYVGRRADRARRAHRPGP